MFWGKSFIMESISSFGSRSMDNNAGITREASEVEEWEIVSHNTSPSSPPSQESTETDDPNIILYSEEEKAREDNLFKEDTFFKTDYTPALRVVNDGRPSYKETLLKNKEGDEIIKLAQDFGHGTRIGGVEASRKRSWKPQIVVDDQVWRDKFAASRDEFEQLDFNEAYEQYGMWDLVDGQMGNKYSRAVTRVRGIALLKPEQLMRKEMRIRSKEAVVA